MNPQEISINEFDYPLPDERIAAHPMEPRDGCMLLVRRHDGSLADRRFYELPDLLPANSLLIYNNTRVINARLRFRKESGALIEIFCLEPLQPADYAVNFAANGSDGVVWQCMVGNSKRWKEGELRGIVNRRAGLQTCDPEESVTRRAGLQACDPCDPEEEIILTAQRLEKQGNTSSIRFTWTGSASFAEVIAAAGELPIPPYLNRATEHTDLTDYQTVFSAIDGSVAAPTAGLHFTDSLLEKIDAAGHQRRALTLHVGAGTFQPVKSDRIGEHPMHSEFISVSRSLIEELATTERPIIAVGTTSVRTLESLYHFGCRAAMGLPVDELPQWFPYSADHPRLSRQEALQALLQAFSGPQFIADTRIIIVPGYEYKVVQGMVTNFHQPRSTLLLLVSAFTAGNWRPMYAHALANPAYRFLSYGDACLLL